MAKKSRRKMMAEQTATQAPVVGSTKVRIANGAGRKPIVVDYVQGETFAQLFKRAGVKVDEDQVATDGKKTVKAKRFNSGIVEPGSTIVISNAPANG